MLSIDTKIELMTLSCYNYEFSDNFGGFHRSGRQQQLNE